MARITEAWTVASEFSSPSNTLDRTARDFFNSLQPLRDLRDLLLSTKRKR